MKLPDAVVTLNKIHHRGKTNWKISVIDGTITSVISEPMPDAPEFVLTSSEAEGVALARKLREWLKEKEHLAPLMSQAQYSSIREATRGELWALVTELLED